MMQKKSLDEESGPWRCQAQCWARLFSEDWQNRSHRNTEAIEEIFEILMSGMPQIPK